MDGLVAVMQNPVFPGKRPQTVWGSGGIMYENVDDDHHDDDEEEGEDNVANNDVEDEDDEVQEDDAEDEEVEDDDAEEDGDADENAEDEVEDDKMLRRTRRRMLRMIMLRKMKTRLMLRKMRYRLVMVQDDEVKEEEDDEVENDDVEEEDDDLEDDDFEEEDRSQDRDPHFVQACAVEMHLTRTFHKSHFVREFTGKRLETRTSQNANTHFVRACAVDMHLDISQEPLFTEMCKKNAGAQSETRTRTHTLCEPAQSKCTWTFHQSHFAREFTGEMPGPDGAPLSSTGLYTYRENTSVWTHSLGKKNGKQHGTQPATLEYPLAI